MFLGLDLGTSGLRGLLVSESGAPLAEASAEYAAHHPQAGYSEQDPADWLTSFRSVFAELHKNPSIDMQTLRGVGISGQMHGAVLLDAKGDVLHPAILWNDTRASVEAAMLDQNSHMRDITGNIVFPGFTAPKLVWMERNQPDTFKKIYKVLLPKDYLSYWLTGEYTSEMSDAAGTCWLDLKGRHWSPEALALTGMKPEQMPRLIEGNTVAGFVQPARADELNLPAKVAVVGGGGDNAAAACGIGAVREGQGFVSLGTSGVLLAARDVCKPAPETAVHSFCHAIPDTWYQMGVILAATDALNWLGRAIGRNAGEMSTMVAHPLSGPSNVRFLPYLSGERTPHNDSEIRGAFLGLDIANGPEDLVAAVMEGVAFALADSRDALLAAGANLDRAWIIGGGARSRFWVETLATVLNMPLDLAKSGEFGAAMGAARLAISGVTGAGPQNVMTPPDIAETIFPNAELVEVYAMAHQKYRASYPNIKAIQ